MIRDDNEGKQDTTKLSIYLKTGILMKFKVRDNLKIYSGIELSPNGWTMVFGGKLAGIKVIVPWTGLEPSLITKYDEDSSL